MSKTIASVSVFILVISLLLTSCGKSRTFEPSGVTGEKAETTKSQRGEIKLDADKFTFYGVQMGMTTDQVQISVGKAAQVYARNDKMFLTEDVKVNEFKNGLDRVVYYIFNTKRFANGFYKSSFTCSHRSIKSKYFFAFSHVEKLFRSFSDIIQ